MRISVSKMSEFQRPRNTTHPITISFYDGFDGPTIRIDTATVNNVRKIKQIFQRLADNELEDFDLLSLSDLVADNIAGLTLTRVETERNQTVHQVDGHHFVWARDSEGWHDSAWLVSGILANQHPGHQYVSDGLKDDVLVMIAYRET